MNTQTTNNYDHIAERAAVHFGNFVNDSDDKRGAVVVRNATWGGIDKLNSNLIAHSMSVTNIQPITLDGENMVRIMFW